MDLPKKMEGMSITAQNRSQNVRQPTGEGVLLAHVYLARSGISQISLSHSLSQLVQQKLQLTVEFFPETSQALLFLLAMNRPLARTY